jgi:SAM-dependent methyltransferase
LFRAFLVEQEDPEHFYTTLARDSVMQIEQWTSLDGAVVLDVGGGPGYFAEAFEAAGARYLSVDSDLGEMSIRSSPRAGSVLGSGMRLPVRTQSVDVCYSSNVLEHVADPWLMADELVRVTRTGGIVHLSFTSWLSPWGGHETSPWHYFGGDRAARRYLRRTGKPPKNSFGESLFPVYVSEALRWARGCEAAAVLQAVPRYLPWWLDGVVRVPGVRELATWNLAVTMRKL